MYKMFISLLVRLNPRKINLINTLFSRCSSNLYIQGQSGEKNQREYFYYIDHNGMLFLDDSKMKNFTSCFKEKKFLQFFYKQLRRNNSSRYADSFPYISPCGPEMNYIRCDDTPIVYTSIVNEKEKDLLTYGYVGPNLSVTFQPEELCMFPETGRVYHPASKKYGGFGLIKSSLSIEISKYFKFGNSDISPPTEFIYKGKAYTLTNYLHTIIKNKSF